MSTLDDLDLRLIALLRVDGRAPVSTLAAQLDVTRATVTNRIERLVASGVVLGFSVRIREELDPSTVRAMTPPPPPCGSGPPAPSLGLPAPFGA